MDNVLKEILKNHWSDTKSYNYISFFSPKTNIQLPSSEYANFWQNYCDLVEKGSEGLYLGEKNQEYMPIIIHGEIHYPSDMNHFMFEDQFIVPFIFCVQKAVEDNLQISDKDLATCFIYSDQDNCIRRENYLVFPFRIQMPKCRTEPNIQKNNIIPDIINYLRKNNVLGRLNQQPINDWNSILQINSSSEPCELYGSRKTFNDNKSAITSIRYFNRMSNMDDISSETDLQSIFNKCSHSFANLGLIKKEDIDEYDTDYWLPLFLSLDYSKDVCVPKEKVNVNTAKRKYGKTKDERIQRFLDMIPSKEYHNRALWLDVGKALFNEYNGTEIGLEKWKSVAKHTSEITHLYNSFHVKNYLTEKTLAWYAHQHSPEDYNNWNREWRARAFDLATSHSHTDVADAFYRMYWLHFVCVDAKRYEWYYYDGHRWKQMDHDVAISKKISGDFKNEMERIRRNYSAQIHELNDEDDDAKESKSKAESKIERMNSLIAKLKDQGFKSRLKKELVEFFHDDKFNRVINSNLNLLGLPSGVLEIVEKEVIIRAGKPEDYISLSTLVDYNKKYHWNHPEVKKSMQMFEKLHTNRETRESYLKFLGSILKGGNQDKIFPTLSGAKHNAKSAQKKLLENILGPDYSFTTETEALTAKKSNSGGASPQIALAANKRAFFLQEPDNGSNFEACGFIKAVSGGDTIFTRLLNQNGGVMNPSFKIILFCNGIPTFPYPDSAIKDRFLIFPFLSTFSDKAPLSEKEQFEQRLFPKDGNFNDNIASYASSTFWIMVEYLKIYLKDGGLVKSDEMIKVTEKYWQDNDIYCSFISEKIEKANEDSELSFIDVLKEFRYWFKENQGLKPSKPEDIKSELTQKLGALNENKWFGLKLKGDILISSMD